MPPKKASPAPGEKGSRWSPEETTELLDLFDAGGGLDEIMVTSKRSVDSVISKLRDERRLIFVNGGYARRDPVMYITLEGVQRLKDLQVLL